MYFLFKKLKIKSYNNKMEVLLYNKFIANTKTLKNKILLEIFYSHKIRFPEKSGNKFYFL
jgi:hypothetical protein